MEYSKKSRTLAVETVPQNIDKGAPSPGGAKNRYNSNYLMIFSAHCSVAIVSSKESCGLNFTPKYEAHFTSEIHLYF